MMTWNWWDTMKKLLTNNYGLVLILLVIATWFSAMNIARVFRKYFYRWDIAKIMPISSLDPAKQNRSKHLPLCQVPSPFLIGHIRDHDFHKSEIDFFKLKLEYLETIYPDVGPGGHWSPKFCMAASKVAIITAFRDRESHLAYLLFNLIPILKRQLLDFQFIIAEQLSTDVLFNKGRLHNAAFEFAQNLNVDCVIFHDVDMIPLDDRNDYGCPPQPRHLAPYTDTLDYKLWFKYLAGGVFSMSMKHYQLVNGYSNLYWGWGGEDDDMGMRVLSSHLKILRFPLAVARYTMLHHPQRQRGNRTFLLQLLKDAPLRYKSEGLNSKVWKIVKIESRRFFHHLIVDVGTNHTQSHQAMGISSTLRSSDSAKSNFSLIEPRQKPYHASDMNASKHVGNF